MPTPMVVVKVLVARFHRKGGGGSCTRPFEEFALPVREAILSVVTLDTDETPVISSIRNLESWVLVTTKRVLSFQYGELTQIENSRIQNVTFDLETESARGVRRLNEFVSLKVTDSERNQHVLFVEPGNSHIAFLNVLLAIRNRSNPSWWDNQKQEKHLS